MSLPARSTEQRYPHTQGCYRTSWGNAWFVQFRHQGERVYLGTYETEAEAIEAKEQWLTWQRAEPQP